MGSPMGLIANPCGASDGKSQGFSRVEAVLAGQIGSG